MQGEIFPMGSILNAQSVLDTAGYLNQGQMANADKVKFYVRFSAGTSAGAVKIESALDLTAAFAGEWALEATVTWAVVNKEHFAIVEGPFAALRVRISTAIVGGTVSVGAIAQRH